MPSDDYSEYEPVETGEAPNTIKGRLPVEAGGADGFAWRKDFNFFVPFSAFSTGQLIKIFNTYIEFKIFESEDVAAPLLFHTKLSQSFEAIAFEVGGSIGFFFWSPRTTKVETFYAEGYGLNGTGTDGWVATDADPKTEFSEIFDIQFDFNDTGAFTADGGYIRGTIYSPAYAVQIPDGAILKVIHDELQVGLIREGAYAFSFKEGSEIGSLLDVASALRFAQPRGGGISLAHRFQRGIPTIGMLARRSFLPGVKDAVIEKTPDNVLWILGSEATVGRLWFSENDAITRPRKKTLRSQTGEETEVVMFGNGYSKFDMKAGPDGVLHAIAQRQGNIYYSRSDRSTETRLVGRALRSGKYKIELGQGNTADMAIYVVNLDHEFVSEDGFISKVREKLEGAVVSG